MAAPSIGSGISQLNASNAASWNSGTVGNADGPINALDLTGPSNLGIDQTNTTQTMENGNGPATTNGLKYSAYSTAWTAIDISSQSTAIAVHFAGNPGAFNRVSADPDGITFYAFDSGGNRATDYLLWEIGGSGDGFYAGPATFYPIPLRFADATANGLIDETDIVEIGVAYKADGTGNFGVDFRVNQIVFVNGAVEFSNGDVGTPGTFERYRNLLYPLSGQTFHSQLNLQVKPAWAFGHSVRNNAEYFVDSNFTFILLPDDPNFGFNVPAQGYYSVSINPSSVTAFHQYTDGIFAYDSGTYDLTIDSSSQTTGSIDFARVLFLNTQDVIIDGSELTMTDCTLSAPNSVNAQDSLLTNLSIDAPTLPLTISGQLASGSSVIVTNPVADAIVFGFNPADDSGRAYTVPAGSTVSYNPTTTGTYTSTGLTNASGSVELDNLSANNITVNVSSDLTFTIASPTTGGGTITAVIPPVTPTITAANIIDNTRVRLYNITQASEIDNSVVSGGSGYSITLTLGVDYNNNDSIVLLATYQQAGVAKRVFRSAFTLSSNDITISDSQVDWDEPNVLGIDGSTVTECTTDFINVEVEVDDPDNDTQKSRIAAFLVDAITTEDGIRNWVSLNGEPVIDYKSAGEAEIDATVATVTVLNTKASSKLLVVDAFILGWSDGVNRADAVLGSSIVWISPDQALEIPEIREIHTRFDLNPSRPNTYQNDESAISNDDFTLTKQDNGDGTFTVNYTET